MWRTPVKICIRWLMTVVAILPWMSLSDAQTARGGPQLSGARDRAAALQAESVGGPFNAVCTASTTFGSNIMTNCDSLVLPHNETAIATDPNDSNHLVAGSNNTQLPPNGTAGTARSALGYYTSFDGGRSWLNGEIPASGFAQASDPAVGMDRVGHVFMAVVSFDLGKGGTALGGAIQVARSNDGGRTFSAPVTVDRSTSDGIQEDKPYLVVDTNIGSPFTNSVYATWTRFEFDSRDNYLESPIFFSASRDGGLSWSPPQEISGRSPTLCTFSGTPLPNDGRCREDQFSSPVVGPDGTIFVAFENDQAINDGQFRDQYLVVKSTDGGATWTPPVRASDIIHDGSSDYPVNIVGRQTLSNSQFRVNSAGNLAIDPSGGHLVLVWSDNRNGTPAATNTNILSVRSDDDGTTWTVPAFVSSASGDQFYPWAAFGPDGTVNVSYLDRMYDPANSKYGVTLARIGSTSGNVTHQRVDTGLSDPNHARWFSGATGGKTLFLGDYTGLAVGSDGAAHPLWTDMRRMVTIGDLTGTTEDIFSVALR
jgi:hypothetical protein